MDNFKFILSKERFAEIDDTEVGDTVYLAKQSSAGDYEVSYTMEDGNTKTIEYYKGEVEVNLKDGFWVKVSD